MQGPEAALRGSGLPRAPPPQLTSEGTELRGAPGPTLPPAFTLGSGSFPPILALNDFSFPLSVTIIIILLKHVLLCSNNDNGSPSGSVVKNPLPMQVTQETQVHSLGREDPLEEEMATHSSILA